MTGYENLDVWKKSMALVVEVYKIVKQLPKEETYALSDQIRRSAVSIPSNIALGSLCELETQLTIAVNVGYLKTIEFIKKELLSIKKMLNSLISSIKRSL